jgi:beta-N-acetylhexosaminidase
MGLKKLIGQLCIFGFDGVQVPDWIRHCLVHWDLGGVILFKRNIESKEQLTELNREIRSLGKGTPPFISVDHEGGRVFRLPPPFTQIPPARQIALENKAYETGRLMGKELREAGFNLNYAPVLDVDTNPNNPIIGDRSFGSEPEDVSRNALELIRGLREEGVIPCGKHFPGHGDTSRDSHLELPSVDHPLSRLEEIEIAPFQVAIADGIEMLMSAHVLFPRIDPVYPATLSREIITGILREKLDYEGVVISDDFLMKAVSDRYGIPEAARLFWGAGGDIVLICRNEEEQGNTLDYLLKAVMEGKISKENCEKSRKRIGVLKARYGLNPS